MLGFETWNKEICCYVVSMQYHSRLFFSLFYSICPMCSSHRRPLTHILILTRLKKCMKLKLMLGCIFQDMRLKCVIYLFGRENITHYVLSKQGFFFLVVGLHNQYFWSDEMTTFQPATISCRLVLAALTAGIYFWKKKLKKTMPFFLFSKPNCTHM